MVNCVLALNVAMSLEWESRAHRAGPSGWVKASTMMMILGKVSHVFLNIYLECVMWTCLTCFLLEWMNGRWRSSLGPCQYENSHYSRQAILSPNVYGHLAPKYCDLAHLQPWRPSQVLELWLLSIYPLCYFWAHCKLNPEPTWHMATMTLIKWYNSLYLQCSLLKESMLTEA